MNPDCPPGFYFQDLLHRFLYCRRAAFQPFGAQFPDESRKGLAFAPGRIAKVFVQSPLALERYERVGAFGGTILVVH